MPTLPLLLFAASCQLANPDGRTAAEYVTKIQPLLQENSLLAERVLFQAAAIYNGATRPDAVADSWSTDIVPLAEHLHHQAVLVQAPEAWADDHAVLVRVWGERANAYRTISEGLRLGDRTMWDEGRALAEQVKVKEEKWVEMVNEQIRPFTFEIESYP